MSNYEYDRTPVSRVSDEDKEIIKAFYSPEEPGTGKSCPICGADLSWNWIAATDLLLHIKWHKNLKSILSHQGKPYPGLPM